MHSVPPTGATSGARIARECPVRSLEQLRDHCIARYGSAGDGWVRRRRSLGYFLPSELYESALDLLISPECSWLDVGGGQHACPQNDALASALVARCDYAVAVDPSTNVLANQFMHHRVQAPIEAYSPQRRFDVATLRMVAEHVADPAAVTRALARLLRPGGLVVVLTVNRWSPISLASMLTPLRLHHPIKKIVWGGTPEDTFPVKYKMNTRRALSRAFASGGFAERFFVWADDLSAFGRRRILRVVELRAWTLLQRVGLRYPENCLIAIYQRVDDEGIRGTT